MKKLLSLLFSATLVLGLTSPAFAATEDDDVAKVLELIEKTNREIDKKIEKAVEEADMLQTNYLNEVRKIEEGDKFIKLKDEREKVLTELNGAKNDHNKEEKLREQLLKLDAKLEEERVKIESEILEVQQEIEEVTAELILAEGKDTKKLEEKISRLTEKLNKRSEKYQEKTQKYTTALGKIITNIYNETLEMSAKTIEKAAEKGVIAECSWKLVRFADRWVWIDPVRVVKL
ncbi:MULTISPECIES: hypothetical protein [unclassified Bacillus (in: firmicutes)]|uniref:hypothetical protein n=1 Tax=unclassified Bacillus (in: firmicutes) TaxID=185979 RepID=UPI0008E1B6A0|nr:MULTISPECIES: hypothetical protein [unclassified Bacillus (in: firmicutes)]SFB02454.1 hypothetical protein SAMN02799634_10485 [Bacillus sp. UNCCL13]SFQ89085.1 hypothetical protein SAMN04488577_3426 [Bacillus sp. cl95]